VIQRTIHTLFVPLIAGTSQKLRCRRRRRVKHNCVSRGMLTVASSDFKVFFRSSESILYLKESASFSLDLSRSALYLAVHSAFASYSAQYSTGARDSFTARCVLVCLFKTTSSATEPMAPNICFVHELVTDLKDHRHAIGDAHRCSRCEAT